MIKKINLVGERYGRLLVLKELNRKRKYIRRFLCRCDCGNLKKVSLSSLRSGGTKSCGCFKAEKASEHCIDMNKKMIKHNLSRTRAYSSWIAMKERCLNVKHRYYYRYGGRGIKICKKWIKIENFYEDMGERPNGKTLDRIDNDGDYTPENCRWATWEEQCSNKATSRFLKYNGLNLTLSQWTEKLGFKKGVIWSRLDRGWSVKKTLTKPILKQYSRTF